MHSSVSTLIKLGGNSLQYLAEPDETYHNPDRPYETKEIFVAKIFPQFQRYRIGNEDFSPNFRRRCSLCGELAKTQTNHIRWCKQRQTNLDYQYIKESIEFNDDIHQDLYSQDESFRRFVRNERLFERTLVIPEVVQRIEKRIQRAIEGEKFRASYQRLLKRLERARLEDLEKSSETSNKKE